MLRTKITVLASGSTFPQVNSQSHLFQLGSQSVTNTILVGTPTIPGH